MKKNINNYILAAFAAALAILCVRSIYVPMHFTEEKNAREEAVKRRLIKIKMAQEAYLKANGTYCGDIAALAAKGFLADSLRAIPHSDGKPFRIRTATLTTATGREVPVMECGATYGEYLSGLDEKSVARLTEEAGRAGRFPGLKIGDIEKNNYNAGNWE